MAKDSKTVWGFKPPGSTQVICIILLGAVGFVTTLCILTSNIKFRSNSVEQWTVIENLSKDSTIIPGVNNATADSVLVELRPQLKARKQVKEKIAPSVTKQWSYRSLFLNYNPSFLVWMALFSVLVAISLAFIPITLDPIAALYKGFGLNQWQLAINLCIVILIGVCLFVTLSCSGAMALNELMAKTGLLLNNPNRIMWGVYLAIFSGLAGIFGQLTINNAIDGLDYQTDKDPMVAARMLGCRFDALKQLLKLYLLLDAVLIVFTIITTDALSRSLNNEIRVINHTGFKLMPQEFVYLYGLAFTLYLALMYLPIQYRLRITGQVILDNLGHKSDEDKELKDRLTISDSPLESFKVALSILAPLVTSLIPLVKIG